MKSLYAYELESHEYAEKKDNELQSIGCELISILQKTEISRQRDVINTLLGRLSFEIGCRMTYGED